ncbi:hypothetical protein N0V88_008181 [Collariella sp. IMI 366227]|nr:hypothetical protein N0V88_008181 [Collariella sp. IMI 366227]
MLQEGRFGQYVSNNIALCCGNDCSARLFAGTKTWVRGSTPNGPDHTAVAVIMFEPLFQYFRIPSFMDIRFNSSNIVQTRLEVVSPTTAKVTFSKLLNSTSSETVSIDITIDQDNGHAVLHYTVTQNGKAYEETVLPWNNATKSASFCGDSAWWYLNDPDDPFHDAEMHNAIAPFSPVLMGGPQVGHDPGEAIPGKPSAEPAGTFLGYDSGLEYYLRI